MSGLGQVLSHLAPYGPTLRPIRPWGQPLKIGAEIRGLYIISKPFDNNKRYEYCSCVI